MTGQIQLTAHRAQAAARYGREHPVALLALVPLAGAVASAPAVAADDDIGASAVWVLRWCLGALSTLRWPTLLCLFAVSVLHYFAAAVAVRAAAGTRMPFGELVAAQLAATAANRVTPAGLGGATLLVRYLTRRGQLPTSRAAAAVSALVVLGGIADVLAFALLVGLGTAIGLAGASSEMPLLLHRFAELVPLPGLWLLGALLAVAVVIVVVTVASRGRYRAVSGRVTVTAGQYGRTLADLVRRPGRTTTLMGASAATTLLLAAGFAAAGTIGPASVPAAGFGALMIGYMLAAAAGNAMPTPGGVGTADASLMGVLLAARMPVASAVGAVLAFRLVTFWSPAVAGVALARWLRRRGAL